MSETVPAAEATQPAEAEPALRVRIKGEPLARLPDDLYIPPDALEIFLDAFEGPLDLLLYLIRRQNLDIREIPILQITRQYMEYIALMQQLKLELAAEYLLMAAWLAEIKSRVLLPRPSNDEAEDEEDPRSALLQRLQEYERFKSAAETLDGMPRMGREMHAAQARPTAQPPALALPVPTLRGLLGAGEHIGQCAELRGAHEVAHEPLSVRERMGRILERLRGARRMRFEQLLDPAEGRDGVVVSVLAILELCRGELLAVEQREAFGPLYLSPAASTQQSAELS